jgi:hypothetical protein
MGENPYHETGGRTREYRERRGKQMTRTTSGNSGGSTFRIDNALSDIALTRRGIIVATGERRVAGIRLDLRLYQAL